MKRLLQRFWLWRWSRTLFAIVRYGVRIHPSVIFFGKSGNILLRRGSKISERVRIDVDNDGCCYIGRNVWISTDVELQTVTRINVAANTTIQRRCTINGTVNIGTQCILAPNVFISSGSHIFRAWPEMPIRDQEEKYQRLPIDRQPAGFGDQPIIIGDDCWLGANVVVMPGIVLGCGCVVGANSVVTKSFPDGAVIAGVPAKQISTRFNR